MKFEQVPFLDLLENIVDNRGKTCPISDSGIPLIATNCVLNSSLYPVFEKVRFVNEETYLTWFRGHPKPGDMLFVTKGTPGRVCWVPNPVNFCIAQDMVSIRAKKELVYPKYLFALLRTTRTQKMIENLHVGTLIPHFKKGDFDQLILPVPVDYEVQKRIGDLYFTFSEKIELNRQTNASLEAIAQAIFKEWFVDFNYPGATGEMIDSELGPIPKGWKVGKLGEVCKVTMGQSPPGESYNKTGEGVPFFQGRADFGFRFPTKRIFTTNPKRLAQKFNTLVSVRAPVGDMNIAYENCCIGRGLAAVIEKDGNSSFTYYFLTHLTDNFKKFEDNGTVFGSINKTDFEGMNCVIPTHRLITVFESTCKLIDDVIYNNYLLTANLSTIRDLLLPELMSGKIDL